MGFKVETIKFQSLITGKNSGFNPLRFKEVVSSSNAASVIFPRPKSEVPQDAFALASSDSFQSVLNGTSKKA